LAPGEAAVASSSEVAVRTILSGASRNRFGRDDDDDADSVTTGQIADDDEEAPVESRKVP
jgi:hypothetical protein